MTMEKEKFDLFGLSLSVSADHRFGTDALLLARFARPLKNDLACDLCTGCGIIPMLFEAWKTPPKKTYALDIQEEAIALLRESVAENGLEEKIIPILGDLTKKEALRQLPCGKFTLVTANPPYYRSRSGAERLSPAQAAARHELLCNLEQVVEAAAMLLKYGGTLKLCHLPERLADIFCLMRQYGIEPKILQFAYGKPDSRPYLALISGKKGGKSGLITEKPVLVQNVNHELFGEK